MLSESCPGGALNAYQIAICILSFPNFGLFKHKPDEIDGEDSDSESESDDERVPFIRKSQQHIISQPAIKSSNNLSDGHQVYSDFLLLKLLLSTNTIKA